MNSEVLRNLIAKYRLELGGSGRIMIRASGTEPKIRVMVESQNETLNETIANDLVATVKKISSED
jgi:phosphoglucosamine mutase